MSQFIDEYVGEIVCLEDIENIDSKDNYIDKLFKCLTTWEAILIFVYGKVPAHIIKLIDDCRYQAREEIKRQYNLSVNNTKFFKSVLLSISPNEPVSPISKKKTSSPEEKKDFLKFLYSVVKINLTDTEINTIIGTDSFKVLNIFNSSLSNADMDNHFVDIRSKLPLLLKKEKKAIIDKIYELYKSIDDT